jgi:excisionase family DNA binding protein
LEKLLTAKQFAILADLEEHAVHRYARNGEIPSIMIGSKRRFPESVLEKWVQEKLAAPAPVQPQPAAQTAAA